MGSVYRRKFKRKDGTVGETQHWHIKYYRNGKPYRERTEFASKTDAEKLLKLREAGRGY